MTRACKDVCGLAPSSSHLLMLRLVGTPYNSDNDDCWSHNDRITSLTDFHSLCTLSEFVAKATFLLCVFHWDFQSSWHLIHSIPTNSRIIHTSRFSGTVIVLFGWSFDCWYARSWISFWSSCLWSRNPLPEWSYWFYLLISPKYFPVFFRPLVSFSHPSNQRSFLHNIHSWFHKSRV
jgi:hypothetical protein